MAKLKETFQTIAGDVKSLIEKIGTLGSLKTTTKNNLVNAINELFDKVSATSGITGVEADQKIRDAISEFENRLKGGALAEEYDTLKEIADKIQGLISSDSAQTALLNTLNDIKQSVATLRTDSEADINFLEVYNAGKQ